MKKLRLAGALVSACVIAGLPAGTALAGAHKTAKTPVRTVVHFPVNGPGGQASGTCFWGTSYTQETWNYIWPDSHTNYEASIDTIPAGGKIVLHGRFPHARFFSFTTSSVLGTIRGHLYDDQIKPDPGSTNPFLPGANRNASRRSFTVTVIDEPDPGPGLEAPNTVYGGVAGQAPGAGPMLIIARVYLPDRARDFTGGVGDPTASYVGPSSHTPVTGRQACADLSSEPGYKNLVNAGLVQVLHAGLDAGAVLRRHAGREQDRQPAPRRHRPRREPRQRLRVHMARPAVRSEPQRSQHRGAPW
jgi:hypothetical protein